MNVPGDTMTLRRAIATGVLAVASIAGLVGCSPGPAPSAGPDPAEVSQSAAPDGVPVESPAPPVVARTQGQVQIFDGAATAPVVPPAEPARGTDNLQLNTMESGELGTYVTDTTGMTLYRFDKDTANPSASNCTGACATTWPPLLINSPGKIYTDGVEPSLVGYVERADGTCQVTINGWPAYYFSKDTTAGDVNGQGVGNTWFALTPQGGKATADASPAGSVPSAGPGY